jgi:hypothetical protein
VSERRASLEKTDVQADPTGISGKADMAGCKSEDYAQLLHRGSGGSMYTRKAYATREASHGEVSDVQPDAREGQAGRHEVTERFVLPLKPGNAAEGRNLSELNCARCSGRSRPHDGLGREFFEIK